MVCKLCQKNGDLVLSHIVPEFLFQLLYDEKHKLFLVGTAAIDRPKVIQKGLRERLLCLDCEKKFSGGEDYARRTLFGGHNPNFVDQDYEIVSNHPKANFILVKGVDYTKFKLFILSVLWRISVSQLEYFQNLNLRDHEEKIRTMLLDNTPLKPNDYGFISWLVVDKNSGLVDLDLITAESVSMPECMRHEFHIGGVSYTFFIPDDFAPVWIKDFYLNHTNEWKILFTNKIEFSQLYKLAKQATGNSS